MSDQPQITQKQIQSRASSQSFSRGKTYYNNGSVAQTIRRGNEIEARCRGSYPEPYRVWAKLSDTGIAATSCTCQYDWGGDCKHIVAMLLTYANRPDAFEERASLQDALMSRDKEDLVDIIVMMVTRYPDLQNIVDRPTPNEVIEGKTTLDMLSIRQDLRDSFQTYSYEYEYYYEEYGTSRGRSLGDISSIAKRFAEKGDWHNASLVYCTILEEFADLSDGEYYDEEGHLAYEIGEIITCMDECLQQPSILDNDNERRTIFHALMGIYIWDVNYGGIDVGADAPDIMLKHIRREDIPEIRKLIETVRDRALNHSYGEWRAKAYNGLLTDLDTLDEVDPEIILERLREQGMYPLLLSKLLELKRPDEADKLAQEHLMGGYGQIQALMLFCQHGYDDLALKIAEETATVRFNAEVTTWLCDEYRERKNQEKLLHWQKVMMKHQPLAVHYQNLKETALALRQWDNIRPLVIDDLEVKKKYDVLTRVYLHDEEWNLAWQTLTKVEQIGSYYYGRPLDLEVAHATQQTYPERAIPVFIKYARKFIDERGRDNYQSAASLLVIVQRLYDDMGEFDTWETLITDMRQEYKTLRAVKDELKKAGL